VDQIKGWFVRTSLAAALLSGFGIAGWLSLWRLKSWEKSLFPAFGILLAGDLLWFGYGRSAQCDPALYYPRIPVLEEVAKSTPGRVLGNNGLPARLLEMSGLSDIRGYDAVDPSRLMDIMAIAADPKSPKLPYAFTQYFIPSARVVPPDKVTLSPVLDMLSVRWLIFRGVPPQEFHPVLQGDDYWVLINRSALPRVYIPRSVEMVVDDQERLRKLASPEFDALKTAYVESPVDLPEDCKGAAGILDEIPTRVTVSVRMETSGLVVLADLWDAGWHAYLNGKAVPILRANHAIRGVVVPPGATKLEFRYEPSSLVWGFRLFGLGAAILGDWLCFIIWTQSSAGNQMDLTLP
jgi:hypothetical protein